MAYDHWKVLRDLLEADFGNRADGIRFQPDPVPRDPQPPRLFDALLRQDLRQLTPDGVTRLLERVMRAGATPNLWYPDPPISLQSLNTYLEWTGPSTAQVWPDWLLPMHREVLERIQDFGDDEALPLVSVLWYGRLWMQLADGGLASKPEQDALRRAAQDLWQQAEAQYLQQFAAAVNTLQPALDENNYDRFFQVLAALEANTLPLPLMQHLAAIDHVASLTASAASVVRTQESLARRRVKSLVQRLKAGLAAYDWTALPRELPELHAGDSELPELDTVDVLERLLYRAGEDTLAAELDGVVRCSQQAFRFAALIDWFLPAFAPDHGVPAAWHKEQMEGPLQAAWVDLHDLLGSPHPGSIFASVPTSPPPSLAGVVLTCLSDLESAGTASRAQVRLRAVDPHLASWSQRGGYAALKLGLEMWLPIYLASLITCRVHHAEPLLLQAAETITRLLDTMPDLSDQLVKRITNAMNRAWKGKRATVSESFHFITGIQAERGPLDLAATDLGILLRKWYGEEGRGFAAVVAVSELQRVCTDLGARARKRLRTDLVNDFYTASGLVVPQALTSDVHVDAPLSEYPVESLPLAGEKKTKGWEAFMAAYRDKSTREDWDRVNGEIDGIAAKVVAEVVAGKLCETDLSKTLPVYLTDHMARLSKRPLDFWERGFVMRRVVLAAAQRYPKIRDAAIRLGYYSARSNEDGDLRFTPDTNGFHRALSEIGLRFSIARAAQYGSRWFVEEEVPWLPPLPSPQ